MTTGTITTYIPGDRIRGIAGLAVRLGNALQEWGRRAAEPPARDEVVRHMAIQRELREGVYGSASQAGLSLTLR